ncbi:MAG: ATP-binding cassette domain-containing protein, partial [Methylocaldum sp.]|nr:ATP-binding cassette domain-containing protein [Methylocaldum sp.]
MLSLQRIYTDDFDSQPPEEQAPRNVALELKGVGKGYGAGARRTEVLNGINLRIEEGGFVAVVGFSGSGKTTLISLMAGLIEADTGELRCNGRPIEGPGPDRGVVF